MGDNRIMADLYEENQRLKARIEELESKHHNECGQIAHYSDELSKAKELLKAAVEDFAKLDRVNTKVRNCMIPDMDCADCPLSWDSVDDSVEPCHNWRYTDEALALIGKDGDINA